MYITNIMVYIFICIILYIQSIHSSNKTINSIDIPKDVIYTLMMKLLLNLN